MPGKRDDQLPAATVEEEQQDPTTRTRQGVTGHKVRYVLLWSLLALLACYGVIVVFFSAA